MNTTDTYQVLCLPNDVLHEKAVAVINIDDEIKQIAQKMLNTMYENAGIGLAANQVGLKQRIIVVDVSEEKNEAYQLANPEIINSSEEQSSCEEGCLSIPKIRIEIKRPETIEVKAIDITTKKEITINADGILATCLQHEIDHLNGVLILDHVSRFRRNRILKQYQKLREENN